MTYKDAGVDIEKGARFAEEIRELMRRTYDQRVVLRERGLGLISLDYEDQHGVFRRKMKSPVLVSATDGVGTKLKVAFMTGRHDTVGIDLVAMSVNDILMLGAEPLFFLDYLATGKLEPEVLKEVISGVSAGCREASCALLGGETAEMPGFYKPGEYDMAGFAVGVVERRRIIDGTKVRPDDVVVGLPSSGLHSNGYSLVRRLFFEEAGMRCEDSLGRFGINRTLGEELLTPTRIYVAPVRAVLRHYTVKQVVHAIVHITGGGLMEKNIPRFLPEDCAVELDSATWERPRIFDAVQQLGSVPRDEMYRTFNMGIGMVLIVAPYYVQSVMSRLRAGGEDPVLIGRVVRGAKQIVIT
ncbi:MAG: phosphoribosylformylglycinamidine cyclo-ligase [Candidatus Brocadiae bacterium]|nr:phosphoribosylformylglycinamidine cyclo-ligase [Candidatus Brocadiia bacterium]